MIPGLSSGTPEDRPPHTHTHTTRPAESREVRVIVILTLLTRFGILDVRHRFGAQGPDGDSQLPKPQKKPNIEITHVKKCQHWTEDGGQ